MMQVNYRLLNSRDIEKYKLIRLDCLKNYPEHFGDSHEEEINATQKFYRILNTEDDSSFLFGAFTGYRLIGICGFLKDGRIKTRHRGDLVQFYVAPQYSGLGFGKTLMEYTIIRAFDDPLIDQILLSVVYTNENAIRLYQKFGFTSYGIIENYFKDKGQSWSQMFMYLTRDKYLSLDNN